MIFKDVGRIIDYVSYDFVLMCILGCVEKHFFSSDQFETPENFPWVWTTNTLKYVSPRHQISIKSLC